MMYSRFLFITQMDTLAVCAKVASTQCKSTKSKSFFTTSQNWCLQQMFHCHAAILTGISSKLNKGCVFFNVFTRVSMSDVSFPKVGLEDDKQSDGGNRSNKRSEQQQQQPQFSFTTRQSAEGDTAHSPVPWGGDGGGDGSSGGDRYAFMLSSEGLGVGLQTNFVALYVEGCWKSTSSVFLSTSKLRSPVRQSSTYVNKYFHPTTISEKCLCMFMQFFGSMFSFSFIYLLLSLPLALPWYNHHGWLSMKKKLSNFPLPPSPTPACHLPSSYCKHVACRCIFTCFCAAMGAAEEFRHEQAHHLFAMSVDLLKHRITLRSAQTSPQPV